MRLKTELESGATQSAQMRWEMGMLAEARDRRSEERVPMTVTIEIHEAKGFSFHSTNNLSEGGAYFDRAIPYARGARVEVTVHLPGEAPIASLAEVVNVPDRSEFGMGLRFVGMLPADRQRLRVFTRAYSAA
jgi:uncharacterized protein (TIGR02266 family)